MIRVYEIDPLTDERWARLLARHELASVFHTPQWLDALRLTYGYRPSALTTAAPSEELTSALVFCRVNSWLTGRRVVSVPFSDHCAPLVDSESQLEDLVSSLLQECRRGETMSIEIRPTGVHSHAPEGFAATARYWQQSLDLRPSIEELFQRLHASCIRRKVLRAKREGFVYEQGRSDDLLRKFYHLAIMTRRRHSLPPQPFGWFRNLTECLGDNLKIRVLSHSGEPAASIITMRFQGTMTYKYGVSDARFHPLGCMPLLLWKAIEDAKSEGLVGFDMGRSDWDDEGLITFKDRWGCTRSSLTYIQYPATRGAPDGIKLKTKIAKRVFAHMPRGVLIAAGNLLYRHIG